MWQIASKSIKPLGSFGQTGKQTKGIIVELTYFGRSIVVATDAIASFRYGRYNTVKKLLSSERGSFIINESDGEGLTPLHIASKEGESNFCRRVNSAEEF